MIRELQTRYGRMFVPDTETAQYGWLTNTGASDEDADIQDVIALLSERPPGVVVDVGASFGCWTLALAPHARSVFSFEPQKAVFECLWNTVQANPEISGKVELFEVALGSSSGVTIMAAFDLNKLSNFGGVALDEINQSQPDAPMVDVSVMPLDAFMSGFAVSFMKIDAEGSEAAILDGARRTIHLCKPLMFVEVCHYRSNDAELCRTIESMGYAIERRGMNVLCVPV